MLQSLSIGNEKYVIMPEIEYENLIKNLSFPPEVTGHRLLSENEISEIISKMKNDTGKPITSEQLKIKMKL